LREKLVGRDLPADLYLVDSRWTGRPVDLKIGDVAIVPEETSVEALSGQPGEKSVPVVITTSAGLTLVEAKRPGIGRLGGAGWASFVRVAEREYEGRNSYRHLERVDEDDSELAH
jgi:hypothetical protein